MWIYDCYFKVALFDSVDEDHIIIIEDRLIIQVFD